jgi:hypothetical protein
MKDLTLCELLGALNLRNVRQVLFDVTLQTNRVHNRDNFHLHTPFNHIRERDDC